MATPAILAPQEGKARGSQVPGQLGQFNKLLLKYNKYNTIKIAGDVIQW